MKLKNLLKTTYKNIIMHIVYRTLRNTPLRIDTDEYEITDFETAQQRYNEWLEEEETYTAGIAVIIQSTDDHV